MLQQKPYPLDPEYIIYSDGRVWSNKSHKFLTPSMRGDYLRVSLFMEGKRISKSIHRLVAETFISNPNNLPQVNHKDENKLNNHVDNLEWVTSEQNANHATRNKRISQTNKEVFKDTKIKRGLHPEAKKVIMCDVRTHEELQTFDSIASACDFLDNPKAQPNITAVCNGRRKTAYKYFWKYA